MRSLNIIDNEIDQYTMLEKSVSLSEPFPNLQASLKELLSFFKKTPPSVQKSSDVSCERQSIFFLWMINYLKTIVSLPNEDFLAMQQLQDSLLFNQPKLTLAFAANYISIMMICKL